MGKMDTGKGAPSSTGATPPKGADKPDNSGNRMGKVVGGVGMGKEDMVGNDKQFNTGKTDGICYVKEKSCYTC
jgi:hypothetical protein